jgi:VWFA-related protein
MKIHLAALLVAASVGGVLGAQQPQSASQPVFRAQSDLVVLHVNVFDGRSDAVPDLPQTAFRVLEDRAPQEITFFSNADVPVAVGLVVDNSASMITRRNMVIAGVTAFADSSHPEDEIFTIVFNEHVQPGLPGGLTFTTSRSIVEASFRRFPAGGMTAVHDAVVAGLEHLEEASHQKRVLILLSDGKDNASRHAEDDMVQRAVRSDAIIYTVSTGRLAPASSNPSLMRKLAEVSGGVAFFPRSEEQVVAAFREVADNIRRGYSLGYVPTNATRDGRYRRVEVNVRVPGRDNLTVRARDGYLAPRDIEEP